MQTFDVIVVGTGGMGTAAACQLARRGGRVLGLDRFPPAHDRGIDPAEQARIEAWITAHLPALGHDNRDHATCLYTMSPHAHFVLGLHPDHPQVAVAAGFSGHGFKFASVVGEVLADLAVTGTTTQPIGFLSPRRVATR